MLVDPDTITPTQMKSTLSVPARGVGLHVATAALAAKCGQLIPLADADPDSVTGASLDELEQRWARLINALQ